MRTEEPVLREQGFRRMRCAYPPYVHRTPCRGGFSRDFIAISLWAAKAAPTMIFNSIEPLWSSLDSPMPRGRGR